MSESAEDEAVEQRLIKRYTNRKLYDTSRSQYVTLEDLAELIRVGEDVRVIDNKSKEDLTSVTLAQIIFEQQKTTKRAMPLSALRTIIQGPSELLQKISQPVTQLRGEAAKQVEKLKRRAEVIDEGRQVFIDAVENLQTSIEEMQSRMDERIKDAIDALTHVPDLRGELDELKLRMAEVERSMARVSAAIGLDKNRKPDA